MTTDHSCIIYSFLLMPVLKNVIPQIFHRVNFLCCPHKVLHFMKMQSFWKPKRPGESFLRQARSFMNVIIRKKLRQFVPDSFHIFFGATETGKRHARCRCGSVLYEMITDNSVYEKGIHLSVTYCVCISATY